MRGLSNRFSNLLSCSGFPGCVPIVPKGGPHQGRATGLSLAVCVQEVEQNLNGSGGGAFEQTLSYWIQIA